MKKGQYNNQVRIIGGTYRGRKITFVDADGLCSTPDSVRERLFNWLGQDLTGMTVLDLFSGSGALGFEASSRNARQVTMVEKNRQTVLNLQQNARVLAARVDIIHQDGLIFLNRAPMSYDLVLLDPPFAWDGWTDLFVKLEPYLRAGAKVYIEAGRLPECPAYLEFYKEGRAGQDQYVLLQKKSMDDN